VLHVHLEDHVGVRADPGAARPHLAVIPRHGGKGQGRRAQPRPDAVGAPAGK
jgi:hypothetical protein